MATLRFRPRRTVHRRPPRPSSVPRRPRRTADRRSPARTNDDTLNIVALTALIVVALLAFAAATIIRGRTGPAHPITQSSRPGTTVATSAPKPGQGYTLTYTKNRHIIRWPCTAGPIRVGVIGEHPADADQVIYRAVQTMKAATGLPLVWVPDNSKPTPQLTVRYLPADKIATSDPGAKTKNEILLGLGGPEYYGSTGQIFAGQVTIRQDIDTMHNPAELHRGVALHELGHALGLGHTAMPRQLMDAVATGDGPPALGTGDRAGLATVGCR